MLLVVVDTSLAKVVAGAGYEAFFQSFAGNAGEVDRGAPRAVVGCRVVVDVAVAARPKTVSLTVQGDEAGLATGQRG